MSRIARNRTVGGLAGVLLAGGLTLSASASPTLTRISELPPVRLSTTTFHDGDSVTMSGTGCVDPHTRSGTGLIVVLRRVADFGRGGRGPGAPTVEARVNADGTFSGTGTVGQPMYPDGPSTAVVVCERPSRRPSRPPTVLSQRNVQTEVVAPPLPDLVVAVGSTFDYVLPCTIEGAAYGGFGFHLTAPGRPDAFMGVPGAYPQSTSPRKGQHVRITAPAGAAPGVYSATAECSISEGGTTAYFAHFSVTITAPRPMEPSTTTTPTTTTPPPTTTGPASEAPGATPLSGNPPFTG